MYLICCSQVQYPHSKSSKMSKVRDFPAVSGSIIWARQVGLFQDSLAQYCRRRNKINTFLFHFDFLTINKSKFSSINRERFAFFVL